MKASTIFGDIEEEQIDVKKNRDKDDEQEKERRI